MEVKASLLEWLLELQIPERELPLAEYAPYVSGDESERATGAIRLSEEAEVLLLNGIGTWSIVSSVLKKKGVNFPMQSNPLKRGRTAIDRLHNWSFIERLLATVGVNVDPDLKALAVAGDCYAVADILTQVKAFSKGEAAEAVSLPPYRDEAPDTELNNEVEARHEGESLQERESPRNDVIGVSVGSSDRTRGDDAVISERVHDLALLQAAETEEEDRVIAASVSRQAKDIYQMPKPESKRLEDSDSCAQFFVRSISQSFGTETSESLKILIEDSGIIEDWITYGRPLGHFDLAVDWLNQIIMKVTDLCFHIASEPSTLSVSLTLISTGIKSRNRQVALTTCFLLRQAVALLSKYFLWKSCKSWFTSSIGSLFPMVELIKRFPDNEISQAMAKTIRAFYREDFPQAFLTDMHLMCKDEKERASFLREVTYAISVDEDTENRVTVDSVTLLFQYFMEQVERVRSEFTKDVFIDAIAMCWEYFDLHPNVEIRIKKMMEHIHSQARSEIVEIRHSAVAHLFSLFEFLLKNGQAMTMACQQQVMGFYVENFSDIFLQHAILSNLQSLLEKYDHVPLTLPIQRLTSKIMEEGKVSSLQLQVLETISQHPNLGIGDAVALFKLLLNLSYAKGTNANTCMTLVLNMFDRVVEEDEAVAALSQYQQRFIGLRLRKERRRAEFLARIDTFLKQREDFTFVSRNLDEQFQLTIGKEEMEDTEAPNKENFQAFSPANRYKRKPVLASAEPRERGITNSNSNDKNKARARGSEVKIKEPKGPRSSPVKRRGSVAKVVAPKEEKKEAAVKKKDPKVNKEFRRRMEERRRKEIEEIKLKRMQKEEALKKKEYERVERERYLRQKHIEKRNKLVKNKSAAKKHGPVAVDDSAESQVIQELVIEALNRRLETDPDTPIPQGYCKHIEQNYYSSLIEREKAEKGEVFGENFHMCLSIVCDALKEGTGLEFPKLLGNVLVKRERVPERVPAKSGHEMEARSEKKAAGAAAAAARSSQKQKPKSVRKHPRDVVPRSATKPYRNHRRSPIYHTVLEYVDEMIHRSVKVVFTRKKKALLQKAKPSPIGLKLQPETSEDRLKYSQMKKAKEAQEKEALQKKKAEAYKAERDKHKARADFLKKKLERQKREKEERNRKILEEAEMKQKEKERQQAILKEKEKQRRKAQREKVQQYKELKAKEKEEILISKVAAEKPKKAKPKKMKPKSTAAAHPAPKEDEEDNTNSKVETHQETQQDLDDSNQDVADQRNNSGSEEEESSQPLAEEHDQ